MGGEGQLVIEMRLTSNIQVSPSSSTPGEITNSADLVSYATGQITAQSRQMGAEYLEPRVRLGHQDIANGLLSQDVVRLCAGLLR